MTNFHVILTEKCGDALLITYLFLLCLASDDNVEVNNYNNIHDYLTSFCIYTGTSYNGSG